MKAKIFHKINRPFITAGEQVSIDDYEEVGSYSNEWPVRDNTNYSPFLNKAFEASNTITKHWSKNKGITGGIGARSTSVGDLMQVDSGGFFEVRSIGFRKIEVV